MGEGLFPPSAPLLLIHMTPFKSRASPLAGPALAVLTVCCSPPRPALAKARRVSSGQWGPQLASSLPPCSCILLSTRQPQGAFQM